MIAVATACDHYIPPPAGQFGRYLRYTVALLLTGPAMTLSLAVNISPPDPATRFALNATAGALAVVVVLLLGGPLLRDAIRAILSRRITAELLFVLSAAGAMAASVQATVTGDGAVYFEVVAVVLLVYTFGKEVAAHRRTTALATAAAWRDDIPAPDVAVGDVVSVRPGERVPVDGEVVAGVGYVAAADLTGEPFDRVVRPGDRVWAGSVSRDALLRVRATAVGDDRQIDRIAAAVDAARLTPTAWQRHADRLAAWLVPAVVIAAVVTFAGWAWVAGWPVGLYRAMAVLLVACPCALGLATPIALWSAIGRLAARGLVVHRADAVERLAAVTRVAFDKTGTLTEERFALLDLVVAPGVDRPALLRWLAAVEAVCDHPVARPFAELVPAAERAGVVIESLAVEPGCGVIAFLPPSSPPGGEGGARRPAGHFMRIGRPGWIAGGDALAADLLADGHRIDVELDGRVVAVAVLRERLRDSAADALAALRELGVAVSVLTGDRTERAAALGLPDPEGGLLPLAKADRVRAWEAAGERVLVVGDGANDAAALAAATVGISLATGSDLAALAADATLHGGDLRAVAAAVRESRDAAATIRRNLQRAVAYNAAGVGLAAVGALHPAVAALLMTGSSLLVAGSSANVLDCDIRPIPRGWVRDVAVIVAGAFFAAVTGWYAAALGMTVVAMTLLRSVVSLGDAVAFGAAGMLAGTWIDAGFQPLPPGCECGCGGLPWGGGPGMWLGMVVAGQLAGRCGPWATLGMAAGMAAGHLAARLIGFEAAGWHLLLMVAGMAVGHAVTLSTDRGSTPRTPARPAP